MLELEKRLKQRVGRQDLVERNILPSLSLPTAPKLFTNTQQLQRAQIADNLQRKMRNRPGRDDLLQMNILPNLQHNIDPGLHAKQLQLKKSKLADTLNDKIAKRPGPLQLLQSGIIEPQLSEVVKGYELEKSSSPTKETQGSSVGVPEISFHSGESYGRQSAPPLHQRHSIAGTSPSSDMLCMDTSPGPNDSSTNFSGETRKFSDSSISPAPSPGGSLDEAKSPRGFTASYPSALKSSLSSGVLNAMTKTQSPSTLRKKQQKRYRKLRYHEYVPPTKSTPKGGKTTPKLSSNSDSPYSALLQQQQLFLQLQVLQQQYPNGVLMQKLPDMINNLTKEQKALAIAAAKGRIPITSPSDVSLNKQSVPQILPVELPNKHNTASIRFEDLKVNDLKASCKEMGMIVSGKKAELVERLMDHNKGMLPASALPDNPSKDSRRQAFSQGHLSSVESQFSTSTVSPTSPNTSPVFKFPSDRATHDSSASAGKQSLVQLPEVFPASSLHKEFNEMIERQKRNYICQKGMSEKSIAPRPELTDLLAIKLPPPSYPMTSASYVDQPRTKGSTLTSNGRACTALESRVQQMASDKVSPQSLPSSPKPNSPSNAPTLEMMESTTSETKVLSHSSSPSNIPSSLQSFTSTTSSANDMTMSQVPMLSGGGINSVIAASSDSQMGGGEGVVSVAGGNPLSSVSYYQQQQSALHQNKRPVRSSMPAPQSHSPNPPTGPPSYSSVMRSRSIAGVHPNLQGLPHAGMNNGLSFGSDLTGLATPPNEMAVKPLKYDMFTPDPVEMAMDTGESSISDIFDILELKEFSHSAHPISLPPLTGGNPSAHPHRAHSSLPHTPQYGTSPTKLNPLPTFHPDTSQSLSSSNMLGTIMPFGNPSLSSQNKSGSDVCLNVAEGRDGQNLTMGSSGSYLPNSNLPQLNWLDLDNTAPGFSPTLNNMFGSLNSHSNPGSLPHDQFHSTFLEDSTWA